MASAQVKGTMQISISQGNSVTRVFSTNAIFSSPGGSPDGVFSTTPEKLISLPLINIEMLPGDQLVFEMIPITGSTLDASDAVWSIPVRVNGVQTYLENSAQGSGTGSPAFTATEALSDKTLVAGEVNKLARYTLQPLGKKAMLGGGFLVYGVEDNTT